MKKIVLLLSFVSITLGLIANDEDNKKREKASLELKGQVLDSKSGEALVGVAVKLNGNTYFTNFNGEFSIQNVIPGQYTIVTSYVAYKNEKIKLSLEDNLENMKILLVEN